jgi:hypothetical protein
MVLFAALSNTLLITSQLRYTYLLIEALQGP